MYIRDVIKALKSNDSIIRRNSVNSTMDYQVYSIRILY